MRFEKLEQRCVMDGAGIGGFCSAMDTPVFSNSIQIEHGDSRALLVDISLGTIYGFSRW